MHQLGDAGYANFGSELLMPAPAKTQAQKFERERGQPLVQPPPPFPRLPAKFVERYPKEIQDVLNGYGDQCQEWVKKYVTGNS